MRGANFFRGTSPRPAIVWWHQIPPAKKIGTIIAAKGPVTPSHFVRQLQQLPYRAASVYLESEHIEVVGVYVPSRDGKHARSSDLEEAKIARKKGFIDTFVNALRSSERQVGIVCGDFNVIPRNHYPPEPAFQEWEYRFLSSLEEMGFQDTFTMRDGARQDHSWVGHFGDRYRFDYCYVSSALAERVQGAHFDHSTRALGLSDHSALRITFAPISSPAGRCP